ncbi:MAG: hypothetical protein ACI9R3_002855 [Verrucomicrobiales bacterium]|jgi:hypothetical protein
MHRICGKMPQQRSGGILPPWLAGDRILSSLSVVALSASLGLCLSPVESMAEPVTATAQAAPTKNGSAANLTGRWSNVATVDGTSVDLLAEILSQSSGNTNDFWTPGDDVAFSFKNGLAGEVRTATVRWTWLEHGTNIPVRIAGLTVTIDDLDDGGGRHESLVTSSARRYTLNRTTILDAAVDDSSLTLTATGGNDLSSGDADGAVKLEMSTASSFTITYRTTFSANLDSSAYHHDLDGDFVFAEPKESKIAATAPHVYFTYNLSNTEGGGYYDADNPTGLEIDFFDSLPDGFLWDTNYVAFTGGSQKLDKQIQSALIYSNGGRDAAINKLKVPSGRFTLTLRTQPTSQAGSISNEATITPKDQNPIITSSTFTLAGATSHTVIVDAETDTTIAQNAPDATYYTSQLYATADSTNIAQSHAQSLIYFDLGGEVGSDATLTSAEVYLTSTDPARTDGPFSLYRILPGVIWKGGTSYTWNVAGNGMQADGNELEAAPAAQSQLATTIPGISGSADRKMWDITNLVQSWLANPATNNGFAILADSPDRDTFCSSEHAGDSNRPKLVITYSGF